MSLRLPNNHDQRFKLITSSNRIIRPKIIGLIRIRNESLVLKDTLDHFSLNTDGVILLDDSSTDNSVAIALAHKCVIGVIINTEWSKERAEEETIHRELLRSTATSLKPSWLFYADADERFEGDIKDYLHNEVPSTVDGIRISLFDSYITENDKKPYQGGSLKDFRKYYGVECRNILMIWRNKKSYTFRGLDAREPSEIPNNKIITKFSCQHYGKSISIQQWEDTCNYYINNFPMYSEKWKLRVGKAIHTKSDFETKLMTWEKVKNNANIIHPIE